MKHNLPLCINCKHCADYNQYGLPQKFCEREGMPFEPVYGRSIATCMSERKDEAKCGPAGAYYEAKEDDEA